MSTKEIRRMKGEALKNAVIALKFVGEFLSDGVEHAVEKAFETAINDLFWRAILKSTHPKPYFGAIFPGFFLRLKLIGHYRS